MTHKDKVLQLYLKNKLTKSHWDTVCEIRNLLILREKRYYKCHVIKEKISGSKSNNKDILSTFRNEKDEKNIIYTLEIWEKLINNKIIKIKNIEMILDIIFYNNTINAVEKKWRLRHGSSLYYLKQSLNLFQIIKNKQLKTIDR